MMAPSIIYCAPIPFNIVFHNANKGKMRINVLDLSRFCCALGRGRTTPGNSSFASLFPHRRCNYHQNAAAWRIRYFVNFDARARNIPAHFLFRKVFTTFQSYFTHYTYEKYLFANVLSGCSFLLHIFIINIFEISIIIYSSKAFAIFENFRNRVILWKQSNAYMLETGWTSR